MNINCKEDLITYTNFKDDIETKAEEILKDYFDYKNWKIPNDSSITDVRFEEGRTSIYYYGFHDFDVIDISIEYFITKDRKYLKEEE